MGRTPTDSTTAKEDASNSCRRLPNELQAGTRQKMPCCQWNCNQDSKRQTLLKSPSHTSFVARAVGLTDNRIDPCKMPRPSKTIE